MTDRKDKYRAERKEEINKLNQRMQKLEERFREGKKRQRRLTGKCLKFWEVWLSC